jgi:tripartite-type tricarboxylate transporter receptor subunit TctC
MRFLTAMPRILTLVLCVLATHVASAQGAPPTFPSKPVRIIVGFPAGGGIDLVGRIIAPQLAQALGQPVVVENKPGANGLLGMDLVAKAPADGHTIFLGTLGNLSINSSLYPNAAIDVDKQFTPLMQVASVTFVLYATPGINVNSVADLVAYGKANPGKLNYSSSGNGGLPHLAGELFSNAVGVPMTHVPYKGSAPSINDVLGGQVQFTFESAAIGLQHVKSGRLKALATTGLRRQSYLPDTPTVAESVPNYQMVNWYGMVVPNGTPSSTVTRLHTEITKILAQPDVREKYVNLGVSYEPNTTAEFAALIKTDTQKWARIVRQQNIKPD